MNKRSNNDENNWLYVLVAFYSFFLYSGCLIYAFSLFVKPVQAHFGWERSQVLLAFTFFMISTAVTSPFVGKIIDRYGARTIVSLGALLTAIAYSLIAFIKSPLHLYLVYIFLGIFATSIGNIPATAIVSASFKNKRGLAIGISTTGVGIGALVISPVLGGIIIPELGWKAGYLIIACVISLMVPLSLLIIKSKINVNNGPALRNMETHSKDYQRQIILSLPFVLFCVTFFMNHIGVMGLTQSQALYLQDAGFSLPTAASMLGVVGLMSASGKFFFGWLCDRIKPKYAYAIGTSISILSMIILMTVKPDSSPILIWSYPVIAGFGMGSWLPTISMAASTTFPIIYYGFIFGLASVAQNFGSSIGPLTGGKILSITGNYNWTFIFFIVCYGISILTMLGMKRDPELPE